MTNEGLRPADFGVLAKKTLSSLSSSLARVCARAVFHAAFEAASRLRQTAFDG
jgi:hypothetical protein